MLLLSLAILGFLISLGMTLARDRRTDRERPPPSSSLMIVPFLRVIPRHLVLGLTVSTVATQPSSLFFFLLIKTFIDVMLQIFDRRLHEKAAATA